MFGMGKGNKADERFWNLVLFRIYATDDEFTGMIPFLMACIAVVVVIIVLLKSCS